MMSVLVRASIIIAVVAFLAFIVIIIPPSLPKVAWWRFVFQQYQRDIANHHTEAVDLNHNGRLEQYSVSQGRLLITENNHRLWQSSHGWWVDDFAVADVDNDGVKEIAVSLWKQGNFGYFKPQWYDDSGADARDIRNHFFVLHWTDQGIREKWASSNLEAPNCSFRFQTNDSGKQVLVAREGQYQKPGYCEPGNEHTWEWNGFGFTKVD